MSELRRDATIAEIVDAADPPAQPGDEHKIPCPDCGRLYVPGTGMGVHRQRAHGTGVAGDKRKLKIPCPDCGKPYGRKDMSRHRRVVHGVKSSRGPGRPPKIQAMADVDADDIFATVVSIIWPDGNVPVASVMALVQWREATQRMLTEVRNERST